MNADRRGVIDIPVKLAVCFLILGLVVPVVIEAADDADMEVSMYSLRSQAFELEDAIHRAYSDGSVVSCRFEIPRGQSLDVGGEGVNGYLLRLCVDGTVVESRFIDNPTVAVVGPEVTITGGATVVINGTPDREGVDGSDVAEPGVRVEVW